MASPTHRLKPAPQSGRRHGPSQPGPLDNDRQIGHVADLLLSPAGRARRTAVPRTGTANRRQSRRGAAQPRPGPDEPHKKKAVAPLLRGRRPREPQGRDRPARRRRPRPNLVRDPGRATATCGPPEAADHRRGQHRWRTKQITIIARHAVSDQRTQPPTRKNGTLPRPAADYRAVGSVGRPCNLEVLTRLADGDLPPPALRAKTRINLTIHTADERQTPPLYRYRQPERPEGRELRALARLPGTAAPGPECDSAAGDQRKTPK